MGSVAASKSRWARVAALEDLDDDRQALRIATGWPRGKLVITAGS